MKNENGVIAIYSRKSTFAEKGESIGNQVDLRKLCKAVDTVLTPRERRVIVARYGLGGNAPMRQREVARYTGISRSYVSRIEKKALEKLKAALE